ncbi:MAG: GNAT family N-acetyltransferase [Anaerolineae bacterium]
MTTFERRAAGLQDLPQMRNLLVERRARYGHGCWHTGDLTWRTFLMTIRNPLEETTRLWFDGDRLAGYALVDPPRRKDAGFDAQIHPDAMGSGIEEEMIDWGEAHWSARRAAWPQSRLLLDAGIYQDDRFFLNALRQRGWNDDHNDGRLLWRGLDQPMPAPTLPPGWSVRPVAGEAEAPRRAAVHRDTFHPSRVTDEQYLRLMRLSGYTPELDLVTVSPEGEFGSFCLGWLDPVNRVGEFEPVGTHSAFRRRGLARAVIIEGLRRMQAAGATGAVIGPIDVSDTQAMTLYESLGFHAILKSSMYAKSLQATDGIAHHPGMLDQNRKEP